MNIVFYHPYSEACFNRAAQPLKSSQFLSLFGTTGVFLTPSLN